MRSRTFRHRATPRRYDSASVFVCISAGQRLLCVSRSTVKNTGVPTATMATPSTGTIGMKGHKKIASGLCHAVPDS
jgi:hypothetical protein